MELDLSGLAELARSPTEGIKPPAEYKHTPETKTLPEGLSGALNELQKEKPKRSKYNKPMSWEDEIGDPEPPAKYRSSPEELSGGMNKLQREADQNQTDRERARAVYAEHQQNKLTVRTLQTELLKGTRAGEDITALYLKAVKALSLLVGDELLYRQIQDDIKQREREA